MIRIVFQPWTRCVLLAVLAVLVISAIACADEAKPNAMEGRIEFDKVKPVLLNSGAGEESDTVRLQWIVFHRADKSIQADLRAVMLSWPKGKWRATASLLDSKGGTLESAQLVFENSGTIISVPSIGEGDLRFTLQAPKSKAARFRVEIQPAAEATPTTAELVEPSWDIHGATNYQDEKADRTLDIDVAGPDGPPAKVEVQLWCPVDEKFEARPLYALRDVPVVWRSEGIAWRACLSSAGQGTIEHVYPNVYRASVLTGWPHGSDDPTPIGFSGILDLTGDNKLQRETIILKKGSPLTVKIVDEKTGKPIPREQLLLFTPEGLPVGSGSSGFAMTADDSGVMRYSSLQPGKYRLEVGPRSWWYAIHPESVKVVTVEVKPKQDNSVTVRYTHPTPVRDP